MEPNNGGLEDNFPLQLGDLKKELDNEHTFKVSKLHFRTVHPHCP